MRSFQIHLKEASNSYPDMAPRSFDDVLSGDIMEWLSVYARDQATMALVASASPGSIGEESVPLEAFDTVEGEQDRAMMDVTEDAIQQETELDEVDIPNLPIKEAERRAGWRSPPQKVRIAIRRLHRQFGHVPQKVQHVSASSTLMQSSTSDVLSAKSLHLDVLVTRRRCPIGMSSIMPWVLTYWKSWTQMAPSTRC